MPQIAIIDDNPEQGGTLKKHLDHYLKKFGSDLTTIVQHPFKEPELFFPFIDHNEVCVLILDERLNDQPTPPDGIPVGYKGNQLVGELRKRLKDFPIFAVTTHALDDDLQAKLGEFEYIFNRQDITESTSPEKFMPIIIRSAQRYLQSNQKELSEFNDLTKQVAAGTATPEAVKRLEALQTILELPFSGFDDRKAWLDQYESHIKELEIIKEQLLKKIDEK